MKKLLLGITVIASMSVYAGNSKIEHSTCEIEKFHMVNETMELNEISVELANKGYQIDLESETAKINEGRTHFVDPVFADENVQGLSIVVGATEQGSMQVQRQARTIYAGGGLTQAWSDVEYFFSNVSANVIEKVDAIASYGHTKSVYVFDSLDESSVVYSKSKKTRNKLNDKAEEEQASREALEMLPECVIK